MGCAHELLTAYGLATTELGVPAGEYEIAGAIGFTGALRGTLVIASTEAVLGALCATTDLADWTAELANQLLGRFKNRLLRHGVRIALATPVAMRGMRLRCATATPATFVMLRSAVGDVVVSLEAVADPSLAWRDDADAALDEGSLQLF